MSVGPTAFRFADVAFAALWLCWARLRLATLPLKALGLNGGDRSKHPSAPERAQARRVGSAVAVAARFVPWRSDCLIQAVATRDWLAANGVHTVIAFGVAQPSGAKLSAHAWVRCGDMVVTGGEVAHLSAFAEKKT